MRATQVEYLHRGTIVPQPDLQAAGVRRILHIFRYDLSSYLHRLDDEPKPVPVLGANGDVSFEAAPRRYRAPIVVSLRLGGEAHEQQATLVLDRSGLRRID